MEEETEDTIPLSQRTKVPRVVVGKKRKIQIPPSPMIEEHPIQVEDLVEEEAYVEHVAEELGNDEFHIEKFDFMPVGTTLEGNKIVDLKSLPLLERTLGIPNLPSITPLGEMEEGEIPLLREGKLEMPPPLELEEEIPMLLVLVTIEEIQGK